MSRTIVPDHFDSVIASLVGPDNCFRLLYAVVPENREVQILAIGVKERNRLIIGGEEVQL